ncbi:MAG TPA: hypothetical protein VM597_07990 [Gemmataceae bacterium]|nr:hypothetical protein [Gemmataceae bacterium]
MLRARTAVRPSARRPLRVESLEDRAVPATAVLTGATLRITAAEGETIALAPQAGQPAGHLTVTDGSATPVFATAGTPVRNVVVKFNAVDQGTLTVAAGLDLPGSLIVKGALAATTVTLGTDVTVGRGFSFRAAPGAAADTLAFGDGLFVGRALHLRLGGGTNAVAFADGTVARGVNIAGGAGTDTVTVGTTAGGVEPVLEIGRKMTVRLGNGANAFTGDGTVGLSVGRGLAYAGGAGADVVDFADAAADPQLTVGRRLSVALGDGANRAAFDALTVGRAAVITGGAGTDDFSIDGAGSVGKWMDLRLGDGANTAVVGFSLNPFAVGGTLAYAGGAGDDAVTLGALTVGRHLKVALGESTGAGQKLAVGDGSPVVDGQDKFVRPPFEVHGNTVVTGGAGGDVIALDFLTARGRIRIAARAGDDRVSLGQSAVTRPTLIRLGTGADTLVVDPTAAAQDERYVTGLGLTLECVTTLLEQVVTTGLTALQIGNLVEELNALGLSVAELTGLAACLAPLGLSAAGVDDLLACVARDGVLDLVAALPGLGLTPAVLTDLLVDVRAGDLVGLTLDLTAALPGLTAGEIAGLAALFGAADVLTLLDTAAGLGCGEGLVAGLIDTVAGLGLSDVDLTRLLTALRAVDCTTALLGQVLTGVCLVDPAGLDLSLCDLGTVLTVVQGNRPVASAVGSFAVFGDAGDDRVTLGAVDGVQFNGRVWLDGGAGADVLVSHADNDYRGAGNRETFETGDL